jgi:hypothetical protein
VFRVNNPKIEHFPADYAKHAGGLATWGAHLRIALELCARSLPLFEVRGQSEHRCLFAFRRPIGWMAAWDIQQSVELARQLKELGADLIDCASGGNVVHVKIPVGAAAVLRRVPPYFRKSRADALGATAPIFFATTLAVS